MLAVVRVDEVNFPLLIHVLGAMLLVGTLVLALTALFMAWRDGSEASARLAFRSLLVGVIPAWIVMRVSAQFVLDKEGLEDAELAWVNIGFISAEPASCSSSSPPCSRGSRRAALGGARPSARA